MQNNIEGKNSTTTRTLHLRFVHRTQSDECGNFQIYPPQIRLNRRFPNTSFSKAKVSEDSLVYGGLSSLKVKWNYLKAQEGFRRAPALTMLRLISWYARCLINRTVVATLHRWHVQMALPAKWHGVGKLIFTFGESYEPELIYLEKLLDRGKVFVDVGANLGIYSLVASKIVGDSGRVVALEPSTQSFPVLQENIKRNRLANVSAFPLAASQKRGTARLYRGPNPAFNSLGRDPSWKEETEDVVTDSLDAFLSQAGINRVDLIKIDVQGAEELVLRGSINVLTSWRPAVIFEIYPEGTRPLGLPPYGAWDLLCSLGYQFFVIQTGVACQMKSPPTSGNVVAIHG
jgi:FkbM family methyltransferase